MKRKHQPGNPCCQPCPGEGVVTACCGGRSLPTTIYLHTPQGVLPAVWDGSYWQACVDGIPIRYDAQDIEVGGVLYHFDPVNLLTAIRWRVYCESIGETDRFRVEYAALNTQQRDIGCGDRTYAATGGDTVDPFRDFDTATTAYVTYEVGAEVYGLVGVQADQFLLGCSECGPPLHAEVVFSVNPQQPYDGPVRVLVSETDAPVPVTGTISGTVRVCEDESSDVFPAATVELFRVGETTALDSTTADGSGVYSFDINEVGWYTVKAAVGTCTGTAKAYVSICTGGQNPTADVYICCAWVCLQIKGLFADTMTEVNLSPASISIDGIPEPGTIDADSSGLICLFLQSDYMIRGTASGTCATRQFLIRAHSSAIGYLDRCNIPINIPCGQTEAEANASPVDVVLLNVFNPPDPITDPPTDKRYETPPLDFCVARTCATESYQGLIQTHLTIRAWFQVKGVDGLWYDILGVLGAGAIVTMNLNGPLVGGTASGSPWESTGSPSPVPDVEYTLTGYSGHYLDGPLVSLEEPYSPCAQPYGDFSAWLRRGKGLWAEFIGAGVSPPIVVPVDSVDCPEYVQKMSVVLEAPIPVCYEELIISESNPDGGYDSGWVELPAPDGAGEKDARYRIMVEL